PRFKAKAKAVGEALKALSADELAVNAGEKIRLTIDGESIEIEPSLVSFESVEEEIRGEEVVPHVIEPSFGIDRIIYTVLDHSFYEDVVDGEARSVLRLLPSVVPIEVAVLPLMDREELTGPAKAIVQELRERGMRVDYDTSGSIGRRYRRNDEIGTPFEVTVDYETLEQGTVTIRDRDSMSQVKVPRWQIADKLSALLSGKLSFQDAGERVAVAKKE
ncbi:MAG: His/Gly/Thr/Pro-type tRNA ligase C-terminal domain-containing protein, partial [Methanothrix sp.]|nr:His/Gly/Thr/Pro-type tRNA ligase C-terminal domain-containing protein [Methanothrix sp.]